MLQSGIRIGKHPAPILPKNQKIIVFERCPKANQDRFRCKAPPVEQQGIHHEGPPKALSGAIFSTRN